MPLWPLDRGTARGGDGGGSSPPASEKGRRLLEAGSNRTFLRVKTAAGTHSGRLEAGLVGEGVSFSIFLGCFAFFFFFCQVHVHSHKT